MWRWRPFSAGVGLYDLAIRDAARWIKKNDTHRLACQIAARFFGDCGGVRAYRRGDMAVIDEIAAGLDFYAALLELPENAPAMSARQYFEIQVMKAGGKQ